MQINETSSRRDSLTINEFRVGADIFRRWRSQNHWHIYSSKFLQKYILKDKRIFWLSDVGA